MIQKDNIYLFNDTSIDIPVGSINLTVLHEIAADYNRYVDELSIIFQSDEALLELNRTYLGHDWYTDIITFDLSNGNELIGELYCSWERIEANASYYQTEAINEAQRVLIHGVLHLCGIGDKSDEEKQQMKKLEDYYLERINVPRGTKE